MQMQEILNPKAPKDNVSQETETNPQTLKCQPQISRLSRKLTRILSKDQQLQQEKRTRLISRKGNVNIRACNVQNKRLLYLADPFTTLLDLKWRWIFLAFSSGFLSSWLLFGTLWWFIVWLRSGADSTVSCVEKVDSWISAFLFSVETQTTIGYGGRQVTPECPEGVLCLLLQSLTGLTLSASLLGLIFAKLSRPRPRAQTVVFSKSAVINMNNGQMRFVFRVGDIRKSQLLEVTIKLHCFRFTSGFNERLFIEQIELPVSFSTGSESDYEVRPFFLTPLTISHVIDEHSPLYHLSAKDLVEANLEFVAILEGVVESTGMVTQAKASYLPDEILWGHEFCPLPVKQAVISGRLQMDFSIFDQTYASSTPNCSSKELREQRKCGHGKNADPSTYDVWVPHQDDNVILT